MARADVTRLSVRAAARRLGMTPARLEKLVAAGAPRNADGTYHLWHLAAWLVSRTKRA